MELLVGSVISIFLAAVGYSQSSFSRLDKRLDTLEVDVAKNYVTRAELDGKIDSMIICLRRLEDKVDSKFLSKD